VILNISRAYYEIEDYEQAGVYYDKAAAADPSVVSSFSYLKTGQGSTGSRASEQGAPQIIYPDGTE
jgi:tetratricopeptide (TPR) repeat protein